jgi:HEAT repeat protein
MGFLVSENGGTLSSAIERSVRTAFNDEKNPSRKGGYAVGLGLMKAETSKEDLRASMDKVGDSNFRGYAAVALGLIGAREYKDYLTQVVQDNIRKPDLLKQASIGLGLMKDKDVSSVLLQLIQPDSGKPSLSVLAAAATAIGFIGDKGSVKPLVDTMNNDRLTSLARAFSAIALGAVAEHFQLPWNSLFSVNINYRAAVTTLTNQNTGILDIM